MDDVRIQRAHHYTIWCVGDSVQKKDGQIIVQHVPGDGKSALDWCIEVGYHSPVYLSEIELRALAAILPKVVADLNEIAEEVP